MKDSEASLSSLLRFIKTFVIHLTAKRALERYCFWTKEKEVDICLFTVERSHLCIPTGSWPKMQEILRASFSSDPSLTSAGDIDSTASRAVEILEGKIQMPPLSCSIKTRRLLDNFRKIILGTRIAFPGGMHCETLLATLGSKYFELAPSLNGDDDEKLKSICKVLF
jgi:hypothetical protein